MYLEGGMVMWKVNWVTWLILENRFDALELLRLFSTTDSSLFQTTKKEKEKRVIKISDLFE